MKHIALRLRHVKIAVFFRSRYRCNRTNETTNLVEQNAGFDGQPTKPHVKSIAAYLTAIMLLSTSVYAAKPGSSGGGGGSDPSTGDIDLGGGYVTNMGFVAAGDEGGKFTNANYRTMAVSIGQLSGVDPTTGEIIVNESNLLPLVAQSLDVTGDAYFYTNVLIAGNTYMYGMIYGNGGGITNVLAENIVGSLADRPEIQSALATKLDSEGVWEAIDANAVNIAGLQTVMVSLEASSTDTNNPHQVTAAQVGAYTTDEVDALVNSALQGTVSADLITSNYVGNVSVTGEIYAVNLHIASNVTANTFIGDASGLTNLPVENISGSFTARPEIQTALDTTSANLAGLQTDLESTTANITVMQTAIDALETASTDTNNPHQVTAAQVGAYTIDEVDALISSTGEGTASSGLITSNYVGNVSITGEIFAVNMQIASNVVANLFIGDGSGLTNLPVANISGSFTERPEIQAAFETTTASLSGIQSDVDATTANLALLQSTVDSLEIASADTNNPHGVTSEQIGALALSGGIMSGSINMADIARIINLPDPANDRDAVSKEYLDRRLSYILPQGDIGMGIYTNSIY